MPNRKWSKTNRLGWIAMHGGILFGGICLAVIAEEHRDGSAHSPAPARAERAGSDTANAAAWIDRQIDALGDPVYGVRAKATTQLIAAGPHVVKRLAKALKSQDREVVRRSQHILSRLARCDEAGFVALENIANSKTHPSANLARGILQREIERRERLMAALAEQRKLDAHRLLREARAAIYQDRLEEARQKAHAARALGVAYNLFDDRPDLVLTAIEFKSKAARPIRTAGRD